MHFLISILSAIIIFAVLVIVHEGGHFFAAKMTGVKVNEFSIGMGKVLFSRKKGETQYSIRVFPLGGFVAMEGESENEALGVNDESGELQNSEKVPELNRFGRSRSFLDQPAWVKIVIAAAGPVMNFVLAVVIIGCLMTYAGTDLKTELAGVTENTPAYTAGLEAGDKIISINGQDYEKGIDIMNAISEASKENDSIDITVKKADTGEEAEYNVPFTTDEKNNKKIGITFDVKHNFISGMKYSFKGCMQMEKDMLRVLGNIATGDTSEGDVVGPVGIVDIVGQTAQAGIVNLIYLMALLSLNLGLINILPLPALDGGKIVFAILRKFTGNIITDEIEGRINFIGLMLIFGLMLFVTFRDIAKFL